MDIKLSSLVILTTFLSFSLESATGTTTWNSGQHLGEVPENLEILEKLEKLENFQTTAKPKLNKNFVRRQASGLPASPSQCSFGKGSEVNTCDWTSGNYSNSGSSSSSLSWRASSAKSSFLRGGPSVDASGDKDGGYVVIETSQTTTDSIKGPDAAYLASPVINSTQAERQCIALQYSLSGPSIGRLRLFLVPVETTEVVNKSSSATFATQRKDLLWESRDDTNQEWRTAVALYSYPDPHKIVLEGSTEEFTSPNRRFRGHIAVDNVDLGPSGSAGSNLLCTGHCNFEGGLCGWANDADDDFDWVLGRGTTNSATGPIKDHSSSSISSSPSRGYVFIDSGYPRRPGDKAKLLSPELEATDPDTPLCLRFWTHMFGNGIGSLRVLIRNSATGNSNKEIWSLSGEAGNAWYQGQVTVSSAAPFRVVFEATVGKNSLGDIAIDDVSFQSGACPTMPQAAAPSQGSCNFEIDECGWTNAGVREAMDDIDWNRIPAEPLRTTPSKDHTLGTERGYFLTLSRSTVPRPGDRAWLISRVVNATSNSLPRCMIFWYFMQEPIIDTAGPNLGSLRIYIRKEENGGTRNKVIWRLHNHQSGVWQMARAQIAETANYRVIVEGLWGTSRNLGAIAVDDIVFYDGQCSSYPAKSKVMQAECNFDKDMCEWRTGITNTSSSRPDADWRLATVSRRPANLPDHTYGAPSGYMYYDVFSQAGRQETLRLLGPVIRTGDSNTVRPILCFTFWFAAFGAGDSTQLRVLRYDNSTNSESAIWSLRVSQLDVTRPDWNFAQAEIGSSATGSDYMIILEGKASNGGFAVDDISIYEGGCEVRPQVASAQRSST